MERVDKILSDSGVGSRKDIKKLIAVGRVAVNGVICRDGADKVERENTIILCDNVRINTSRYRYFVMNKPSGVITATEDKSKKTVLDLLSDSDRRLGLFPVGRLDKDTTGLLLLTNDGDFAHKIISPGCHVNKCYIAHTDGTPDENAVRAFASGLVLSDGTECQTALLEIIDSGVCAVTIHEGKYHQVKRMLAAVGCPVLELNRISVGGFKLGSELPKGAYRELSEEERKLIFI